MPSNGSFGAAPDHRDKIGKPLRVLIVDDSEDDTLLLIRGLSRGGFKPEFERVETPEGLAAALAKKSWDIIISDYAMPHFSGLAALRSPRERVGHTVPAGLGHQSDGSFEMPKSAEPISEPMNGFVTQLDTIN